MMASPASAREQIAAAIREETVCRLCGVRTLENAWSFGATPLANAYLTTEELGRPEVTAPLEVARCTSCNLVQLRHTVAPEVLFHDYLYVSSTSPVFRAHFMEYARELTERFGLSSEHLVVDVGSNDGILLKPLRDRGVRVLGVEPAQRIADLARADGIETMTAFFDPACAREIRAAHGPAHVVTANNVFAHTPDLVAFATAAKHLLTDNGVFVFEVQYLEDLLANNLFDIVYHEHLCYYHLTPLVPFFARLGMEVFNVRRIPVHGGSIRVFVQRAGGPHARTAGLDAFLKEERQAGLETHAPLAAFADRVERNKRRLHDLLDPLRAAGKRIVGYGAPAKATTLLYTFGIGAETLDYIVDDDRTFKQGRFMPGSHIPIVSPDRLYEDHPDYALILAWNFAEPIMKNHARFTEQGGHFIIPVPEPRIIA